MWLEHCLSALLQLHLHSQLNTWLQWIGQKQLQDKTRNIYVLGLGASYIRELTVFLNQEWQLQFPSVMHAPAILVSAVSDKIM